jgi:RHS repeat-associated protein
MKMFNDSRANNNGFHNYYIHNLCSLVDSKDSANTSLNPDDIVLDTIAPFDNTIFSKQNLGLYKYTYHNDSLLYVNNKKPANAVKQIESSSTDISHYGQKLTYTSFNSVETIRDTVVIGRIPSGDSLLDVLDEYKKQFYYGSNGQRVLMVSYRNDTLVAKKYYIGEYEYTDSVEVGKQKEVTFISAPTGLVAAKVKIDSNSDYYYILTDHLGSITQLLTDQGMEVPNAKFTYDAWGRLRDVTNTTDPYILSSAQTANFHILDRGYCGHEHLLEHGIINMNGRIYDPVVGQFMQADNYIQTPEDFIGYNRYSYCRHNPFKYTDPSGEIYSSSGSSRGGGVIGMIAEPVVPSTEFTTTEEEWWAITNYAQAKFAEAQAKALAAAAASGGGGTAVTDSTNSTTGDTGTNGVSQGVVCTDAGVIILNPDLITNDTCSVYNKNGDYLGFIEIIKFTITSTGLDIEMGYNKNGTIGIDNIQWIQTIKTNYPNNKNFNWFYNDPTDGNKYHDNLPYYYDEYLQQNYSKGMMNGKWFDYVFQDEPGRPFSQNTNGTWWFAELSLVSATSSGDVPIITFSYGFSFNNAGINGYYPNVIQPTNLHLSFFRK